MLKFKFDIGVLMTIDFSTNQSRHFQNVIFRGKPQSLGRIPNLSRFLQCFSILIFIHLPILILTLTVEKFSKHSKTYCAVVVV